MITLDRHHQSQDPKQTTADIEDGSSRPGCNVKLLGKMFPARHLDRHTLGQRQSNGCRANPLLRQDRASSRAPLLHDPDDLFISHQVQDTSYTIREKDRCPGVLNTLIYILHDRTGNGHQVKAGSLGGQ